MDRRATKPVRRLRLARLALKERVSPLLDCNQATGRKGLPFSPSPRNLKLGEALLDQGDALTMGKQLGAIQPPCLQRIAPSQDGPPNQ